MRHTRCVSDFCGQMLQMKFAYVIFLSFGILYFVVKNISPVPSIRSTFGLVFLMTVQNLPNSLARERVQVGPLGPATILLVFPCFPDPSVKC